MVDLHKGLDGFDRLDPDKDDGSEGREEIRISEGSGDGPSKLYDRMLEFVKHAFKEVKDGNESKLSGEDILAEAKGYVSAMSKGMERDDLVRLVFSWHEIIDDYLYSHSVNVALLCVRIALELNFSDSKLTDLTIASLFHDIGMMKVKDEIWNKRGSLTPAEYELVKMHSNLGAEVVKGIKGIDESVPVMIAQHQEKIDGTGYPGQLKKEQIHFGARLLSLVDDYEARIHPRPWRQAMLPDKAIQNILDEEISCYDPYFVKALLKYVSIFPVGSLIKISTGEIGRVVKTNTGTPMRPLVKILFDRKGKEVQAVKQIDLSTQLLIYVENCVDPEAFKGS